MTLVRQFEDADHMPDSGVLVVRDAGAMYAGDEMTAGDAHPCGTIVRAGQTWLYASGGDGPCIVRLRAHTSRPEEDAEGWTDVVETPYESLSGAVGLSLLTGGGTEEELRLGEAGLYQVRVAHRPLPASADEPADPDDDDDEFDLTPTDLWQLDFWPGGSRPEAPRWLRRERPAVRRADPGWGSVFDYQQQEIANLVEWVGGEAGMTADDLQQWGADHHRGPDWLDQPLPGTFARDGYPSLADLAGQAGQPEPSTRRELLPLFVALGVLTFDGNRYAAARPMPLAEDVLHLDPDVVKSIQAGRAVGQFTGYAADLVSVARWGGGQTTVAELAARTMASEDDVLATLRYAEGRKLLRVDRSGDQLTISAGGS